MNHELFKQLKTELAALSDSRIELDKKINSWKRLLAENQRANDIELTRLEHLRTGVIFPVQEGTAIAPESGEWFAGGTKMPDTQAMLDPKNLAEMLTELDGIVSKKR